MRPKTSSRKDQNDPDRARLESILKETSKLILARRISRAISLVSKGTPLTVMQTKDVLRYVLDYFESHPDAKPEEGLPEVFNSE